MKSASVAAWVRCPCCENFLCTIHGGHVHECPCPPVDEWTSTPYKPMDSETRDKIREANRRRANCQKCGASSLIVVDGSQVGGLPGINYRHCPGCGWSRAITSRPRKGI